MSPSDITKSAIFGSLLIAGSIFLAYIAREIGTLLCGFGAGALLAGAVFVVALLTGTLRAKVQSYDPKQNRFIKEHPILYGFLFGLVLLFGGYLILHVIPAYVTVFALGAALGLLVPATIVAWNRLATGEA